MLILPKVNELHEEHLLKHCVVQSPDYFLVGESWLQRLLYLAVQLLRPSKRGLRCGHYLSLFPE